jgi:hypothetical protein
MPQVLCCAVLTCALLAIAVVSAVPVLAGRSALQAYTDLMVSFRSQFKGLLGSVVTDANVGLGPKGELRYPSNPLDSRWNFPGIGEFQVCSRVIAGTSLCFASIADTITKRTLSSAVAHLYLLIQV